MTNNTIYKVKKVYDSPDMPKGLARRMQEDSGFQYNNDTFIGWTVGDMGESDTDKEVDSWLRDNGAEKFEDVVIHFWW